MLEYDLAISTAYFFLSPPFGTFRPAHFFATFGRMWVTLAGSAGTCPIIHPVTTAFIALSIMRVCSLVAPLLKFPSLSSMKWWHSSWATPCLRHQRSMSAGISRSTYSYFLGMPSNFPGSRKENSSASPSPSSRQTPMTDVDTSQAKYIRNPSST